MTIDTTIETNAILDPKNITRKISKSNKEEWEIEETDARGRKAERRKNSDKNTICTAEKNHRGLSVHRRSCREIKVD